ncbi:endo-13-14-beta-D-glucanase-like protein [Trifolium medium]|uniref:Endo-13-14-beta-D-glucanase-like protein n=1 Tax=Trifolium medium TaxID=97028 RepID=A0A392LYL9_9FABA|nr:endo-13-14-beta-D-glucanase-like protein [Trifolium medium]
MDDQVRSRMTAIGNGLEPDLRAKLDSPMNRILVVKKRKLADKVSEAGFFVVVPDLLYGDYFDIHNPQFDRASWLEAHGTDKACEDTKPLIAALRSKGVTSIGAAGFCWGVVKLASSSDNIQAAVILHPGSITDKEFNDVKVPIALLGAEVDTFFPLEKLKQAEELLSSKAEVRNSC